MTHDITDTITKLDRHFRGTDSTMSERERLFSRAVKLNEEVGELCEAILVEHDTNQRKKERTTDLDAELADVVICTLLLAHGREKDIWESVHAKLEAHVKRFGL